MTITKIIVGTATTAVLIYLIIWIDRFIHKKRIKDVWKGKFK